MVRALTIGFGENGEIEILDCKSTLNAQVRRLKGKVYSDAGFESVEVWSSVNGLVSKSKFERKVRSSKLRKVKELRGARRIDIDDKELGEEE